jgi:hypothetical protein
VISILSSVLARFTAFTDQIFEIFENDNKTSFEAKVPFHHQEAAANQESAPL